ncbi:unnamed protein product [Pedinophyceae sp. YPF-701]|nr:unnamed protein product [Pedinophyceae sp. YPF-701]
MATVAQPAPPNGWGFSKGAPSPFSQAQFSSDIYEAVGRATTTRGPVSPPGTPFFEKRVRPHQRPLRPYGTPTAHETMCIEDERIFRHLDGLVTSRLYGPRGDSIRAHVGDVQYDPSRYGRGDHSTGKRHVDPLTQHDYDVITLTPTSSPGSSPAVSYTGVPRPRTGTRHHRDHAGNVMLDPDLPCAGKLRRGGNSNAYHHGLAVVDDGSFDPICGSFKRPPTSHAEKRLVDKQAGRRHTPTVGGAVDPLTGVLRVAEPVIAAPGAAGRPSALAHQDRGKRVASDRGIFNPIVGDWQAGGPPEAPAAGQRPAGVMTGRGYAEQYSMGRRHMPTEMLSMKARDPVTNRWN